MDNNSMQNMNAATTASNISFPADNQNIAYPSASVEENELSQTELLKQLLKKQSKQLFATRILCIIFLLLLVVFSLIGIILVPKAVDTMNEVITVAQSANNTLQQANDAIEDLDAMSKEVTSLGENFNEFMSSNTETLTSAVNDIAGIDFEGLNQAIQDLQDAVGPFASFMNKFGR